MPGVRSAEAIARRNARRSFRRQAHRIAQANGYQARPRLPPGTDPKQHRARQRREQIDARPFIGCDGEGVRLPNNEFAYTLFRIGDRELYRNGKRLETPDLLSFILQSPPSSQANLVGFAFTYDIANILRDVRMPRDKPEIRSRMERILNPDEGAGDRRFRDPWTWLQFDGWPEFGVAYLDRHWLKVCYAERYEVEKGKYKGQVRRREKFGSRRVIWDTWGFFQGTFLRALNAWGIGAEHVAMIERQKDRRSKFRAITPAIRRYNKTECDLLAEMMEAFRKAAIDAGIHLDRWYGAGAISDYMLRNNGALKRVALEKRYRKGLLEQAHAAFYGGRFEVTRIGHIDHAVLEADINSAYPAGLQTCPCHQHGKWKFSNAATLQKLLGKPSALFVAPVRFHHPKSSFICGLPFRLPSGSLMFPRDGCGVYWSVELRSARALGAQITVEGPGWLYEKRCDCPAYAWLKDYYEARRALGKALKGVPIKLGSNGVYGKLVQRVGGAPWQNIIDGGLATAWTRARLNHTIAAAGPRTVVMIATDAVYIIGDRGRPARALSGARSGRGSIARARRGLPGTVGDGLGEWDVKVHDNLFIAMAGLYWPPKGKVKTRGISPRFFTPVIPQFHRAWAGYLRRRKRYENSMVDIALSNVPPPPFVLIEVEQFIGLRLAMHRRAYGDVCKWLWTTRMVSMDWKEKRGVAMVAGRSLILDPRPGDKDARSLIYRPEVRQDWSDVYDAADYIERDLMFDAMPDDVDLDPPFKE